MTNDNSKLDQKKFDALGKFKLYRMTRDFGLDRDDPRQVHPESPDRYAWLQTNDIMLVFSNQVLYPSSQEELFMRRADFPFDMTMGVFRQEHIDGFRDRGMIVYIPESEEFDYHKTEAYECLVLVYMQGMIDVVTEYRDAMKLRLNLDDRITALRSRIGDLALTE